MDTTDLIITSTIIISLLLGVALILLYRAIKRVFNHAITQRQINFAETIEALIGSTFTGLQQTNEELHDLRTVVSQIRDQLQQHATVQHINLVVDLFKAQHENVTLELRSTQSLVAGMRNIINQEIAEQAKASSENINNLNNHINVQIELVREGINGLIRNTLQRLQSNAVTLYDVHNIVSTLMTINTEQKTLASIVAKNRIDQDRISASIGRIDRVLSGAQSRGALGEYLVAEQLKHLPPEWIARDVGFPNNTRVEFALRTSVGRLVPIDSKWVATELLDRLEQTNDWSEKNQLIKQIQMETLKRAVEVLKYRDKDRTLGFCIVAVPDPVFVHAHKIQPTLIKAHIALVSYSLLLPYILILIDSLLANERAVRLTEMAHSIKQAMIHIEEAQAHVDDEVKTKFSIIKDQQVQYGDYNQQLIVIMEKVQTIQHELEELQKNIPGHISTLSIPALSVVPSTVQEHLSYIRDSIIGISRHATSEPLPPGTTNNDDR